MIEITHAQAQRMVSDALDRRIPEEQWVVLQSHLERCLECRNYQAEMAAIEKSLQRNLLARWQVVAGPENVNPALIADNYKTASRIKSRALQISTIALVLLILWVSGGFQKFLNLFQRNSRTVSAPQIAAPVNIEPVESNQGQHLTSNPGKFTGQVVFETRIDASSDLYLVEPGGAPVNLFITGSQAGVDETFPAWSPDGNWVAYLSNPNGKNEVFISDPAGISPVQLTSASSIEWFGPLSWSPDGQWIALTGVRSDQGRQSWVYILPVDGSGEPRALAGTRGGWAPEFSPAGNRLAYAASNGIRTSVAVFYFSGIDQPTSLLSAMHWTSVLGPRKMIGPGVFMFDPDGLAGKTGLLVTEGSHSTFQSGAAIDWSHDGFALAFLGAGTGDGEGAQVNAERELKTIRNLDEYALVRQVSEADDIDAFRGVTWSPAGAVIYLTKAGDTPGDEICWRLNSRWFSTQRSDELPPLPGDLCVEGGLDNSAWTSDGRWLVLSGRLRGEDKLSLYALAFPGPLDQPGSLQDSLVKISDLPGEVRNLRVRPMLAEKLLAIEPQPVRQNTTVLQQSDVGQVPGRIVYTMRNNLMTVVVSAAPDGKGGRVLVSSSGENRCPRFSPDGSLVAFISNSLESITGTEGNSLGRGGGSDQSLSTRQEIYVLPSGGGDFRQVSNAYAIAESSIENNDGHIIRYDCPSWSPDGKHLAAITYTGSTSYLAILPVQIRAGDDPAPEYIRLGGHPASLTWASNSRSLVIGYKTVENSLASFLLIRLPENEGESVRTRMFRSPSKLGNINGLVLSDNETDLYMLSSSEDQHRTALWLVRLEGWVEANPLVVGMSQVMPSTSPSALTWLGRSGLGMVLKGSPDDREKSLIQRIDPRNGIIQTLAAFEDMIYSAAWSEDGRWVIFSAESGLWALDTNATSRGTASPVWISPEPVFDLDWN